MGKLVVVQGDSVRGTDTHNVKGPATPPPPGATYIGTGNYQYVGSMTDTLSDFVTIGGRPAAVINSKSSLDPGESIPPAGKHSGPQGSNFVPPTPAPVLASLSITDPIGTGIPNAAAGSVLLTINGTKVLLDNDKIDTCDGTGHTANSTVSAQGQDFVTCSD